jgi:hypothetical protein
MYPRIFDGWTVLQLYPDAGFQETILNCFYGIDRS